MEKNKLMEMKIDNGVDFHRFEADNIPLQSELTVTVTLSEYRTLVYKAGRNHGRAETLNRLEERVAELEKKLDELKGELQ